jgi:hypothetical protein
LTITQSIRLRFLLSVRHFHTVVWKRSSRKGEKPEGRIFFVFYILK